MDVSIIIVNYNTKDLTRNCLSSIFEQTKDINFEVIISDNGSKDGSIEMIKSEFPQVVLIENNANLGFGKANNKGLEIAKGKYIFYLNSDTILLNNAVKIFFDYWENSKENLGALGCQLLGKEMELVTSYGSFPTSKKIITEIFHNVFSTYHKALKHWLFGYKFKPLKSQTFNYTEKNYVDFIIGADLFVKNNKFAKFDENIFMYYEEVDLQYIMKKNNLIRKIINTPKIVHLEGKSSTNIIYECLDLASFRGIHDTISKIYFLKKHKYNFFIIFILQIFTLVLWINPILYKNTKKYIKYIFYPKHCHN